MQSFLSHLECTWCGRTLTADEPARTCPDCGKVLFARYDLDEAARHVDRTELQRRAPNLWRYYELLPVRDEANVVSLGEGLTPPLLVRELVVRIVEAPLQVAEHDVGGMQSLGDQRKGVIGVGHIAQVHIACKHHRVFHCDFSYD